MYSRLHEIVAAGCSTLLPSIWFLLVLQFSVNRISLTRKVVEYFLLKFVEALRQHCDKSNQLDVETALHLNPASGFFSFCLILPNWALLV